MQTINVTKDCTYPHAWFVQYRIAGWGNPAGEVYDLKNGEYLALVNTQSTGYRRKIGKSLRSACAWVEKQLADQYPSDNMKFNVII